MRIVKTFVQFSQFGSIDETRAVNRIKEVKNRDTTGLIIPIWAEVFQFFDCAMTHLLQPSGVILEGHGDKFAKSQVYYVYQGRVMTSDEFAQAILKDNDRWKIYVIGNYPKSDST